MDKQIVVNFTKDQLEEAKRLAQAFGCQSIEELIQKKLLSLIKELESGETASNNESKQALQHNLASISMQLEQLHNGLRVFVEESLNTNVTDPQPHLATTALSDFSMVKPSHSELSASNLSSPLESDQEIDPLPELLDQTLLKRAEEAVQNINLSRKSDIFDTPLTESPIKSPAAPSNTPQLDVKTEPPTNNSDLRIHEANLPTAQAFQAEQKQASSTTKTPAEQKQPPLSGVSPPPKRKK